MYRLQWDRKRIVTFWLRQWSFGQLICECQGRSSRRHSRLMISWNMISSQISKMSREVTGQAVSHRVQLYWEVPKGHKGNCDQRHPIACPSWHRSHSNIKDPPDLDFDGLVQDCSNSSALAMELLPSCTEPSTCCAHRHIVMLGTKFSERIIGILGVMDKHDFVISIWTNFSWILGIALGPRCTFALSFVTVFCIMNNTLQLFCVKHNRVILDCVMSKGCITENQFRENLGTDNMFYVHNDLFLNGNGIVAGIGCRYT